jgi:23S rRNA (uracil1939-C5)-methyltransferase
MPAQTLYEFKIQSASYGGDGVGRLPDGQTVFIPYVIPGETVRARLLDQKKNFARAELVELLQPSLDRVTPRCPHFGQCGGCHYQHLDYPAQLNMKRAILAETFRRLGGITDLEIPLPVASPSPWNYRNHIQFHLTPEGKLGYQAGRSHRVIPVEECHLPLPILDQAWRQLNIEDLPGLERIALRAGVDDDVQIIIESSSIELPEMETDLPDSVVHLSPAGQMVMAGSGFTIIEVAGREFQVSAGSFFQVNTAVAAEMVHTLLAWLPEGKMDLLLDLYCGVGLFSAFAAPRTERLVGVELSESACQDFAANLDEFESVELYQGAAEDVLPELHVQPDVAVVDPPRAGLDANVIHLLVEMQPAEIIYVSCDPTTLARDLKLFLQSGYRIDRVQPFDLFPQTFHVETMVLLRRFQSEDLI